MGEQREEQCRASKHKQTPPQHTHAHTPQGKIYVHLRGLSTSDSKLFEGKKRYTWGFAQGRFKRPLK